MRHLLSSCPPAAVRPRLHIVCILGNKQRPPSLLDPLHLSYLVRAGVLRTHAPRLLTSPASLARRAPPRLAHRAPFAALASPAERSPSSPRPPAPSAALASPAERRPSTRLGGRRSPRDRPPSTVRRETRRFTPVVVRREPSAILWQSIALPSLAHTTASSPSQSHPRSRTLAAPSMGRHQDPRGGRT